MTGLTLSIHAASRTPDDCAVIEAFQSIPDLLANAPLLLERGKRLNVDCLLGPDVQPFHVTIRAGHIVDMTAAPVLMRSSELSYRASTAAWREFWQPHPRAGWHDLLALTKRGEAILEGNLQPFMTHLQFFKDVLALPRHSGGKA